MSVLARCRRFHASPLGPTRGAVRLLCLLALLSPLSGACSRVPGLVTQYEYDETIDLSLDGSAVVYVSASIPALVALRGLDLNPDPLAQFHRAVLRQLYTAPGVTVRRVSTSRRNSRRFVHLTLDVDDVRQLTAVGPLSWSRYQLNRLSGEYVFTQTLAPSARRAVPGVTWTGRELVAFRVHLPSRVLGHNAPAGNLKRGNILLWEQSLADRLAGRPARFEARMETQSILSRALWIFVLTFLAAVTTLVVIVRLMMRQGRKMAPVADGSQHA
jgi:hypothetical protein